MQFITAKSESEFCEKRDLPRYRENMLIPRKYVVKNGEFRELMQPRHNKVLCVNLRQWPGGDSHLAWLRKNISRTGGRCDDWTRKIVRPVTLPCMQPMAIITSKLFWKLRNSNNYFIFTIQYTCLVMLSNYPVAEGRSFHVEILLKIHILKVDCLVCKYDHKSKF